MIRVPTTLSLGQLHSGVYVYEPLSTGAHGAARAVASGTDGVDPKPCNTSATFALGVLEWFEFVRELLGRQVLQ